MEFGNSNSNQYTDIPLPGLSLQMLQKRYGIHRIKSLNIGHRKGYNSF